MDAARALARFGGIVVDANRIDVCYREAYPDRAVVACESIVRKK